MSSKVVTQGDQRQHSEVRWLFWFGVTAVSWIAGAFAHG
jgi:hypothetical protein